MTISITGIVGSSRSVVTEAVARDASRILRFDHATYDERRDVLYLHIGHRQAAANSEHTPGSTTTAS